MQRLQTWSTPMDSNIAPQLPLTLRRVTLFVITLVVGIVMGSALIASWNEPQVASRLELYQTDLLLRTTAWDGGGLSDEQAAMVRQNLLGDQPLQDAQKTYDSVRTTALKTIEDNTAGTITAAPSPRLQAALTEQSELLDLLDLRLGILNAEKTLKEKCNG